MRIKSCVAGLPIWLFLEIKKQMHDSVITEKEYDSKDWTCAISMFLTSFNVYFVCGYACFMCASKLLSGFFETRYGFFW